MSLSLEDKVKKEDTPNYYAVLPQQKVTLIVFTESKERYLETETVKAIESSMIWWYDSGWNSKGR